MHPVGDASAVLETPKGTICVDPVGDAAQYEEMSAPDLILITHAHGTHYNAETLQAIVAYNTAIIANPAVMGMPPDGLRAHAVRAAIQRSLDSLAEL